MWDTKVLGWDRDSSPWPTCCWKRSLFLPYKSPGSCLCPNPSIKLDFLGGALAGKNRFPQKGQVFTPQSVGIQSLGVRLPFRWFWARGPVGIEKVEWVWQILGGLYTTFGAVPDNWLLR